MEAFHGAIGREFHCRNKKWNERGREEEKTDKLFSLSSNYAPSPLSCFRLTLFTFCSSFFNFEHCGILRRVFPRTHFVLLGGESFIRLRESPQPMGDNMRALMFKDDRRMWSKTKKRRRTVSSSRCSCNRRKIFELHAVIMRKRFLIILINFGMLLRELISSEEAQDASRSHN